MVLTHTASAATTTNGIRQIDVRKDLGAVAELISDAFADELDASGRASLREMRTLSRLGPLLYILVPPDGEMGGFFRGFVWEADGEVVGNITIQQIDSSGHRWMIANVVVRDDHRGHGIARSLMDAALDRIRQLGGEWAVLQVREDNEIARGLYERMGFNELVTETKLHSDHVPAVPKNDLPPGVTLKPLYDEDWPSVNYLLRRSVPELARWLYPSRRKGFRQGSDAAFTLKWGGLIGFGQHRRLGLYLGTNFMGVLDVQSHPRGEHEIDLLLHPDIRDEWTVPLLHHGLWQLQRYQRRPVNAIFFDYQPRAIATLRAFGFRPTNVLMSMRKRILRSPDRY